MDNERFGMLPPLSSCCSVIPEIREVPLKAQCHRRLKHTGCLIKLCQIGANSYMLIMWWRRDRNMKTTLCCHVSVNTEVSL